MRVPEGRFAPIRTAIGSEPAKATMQLLHQTCRSRIDRLNEAGVTAGSSGKCGDQQRFSASTSSVTSSVRQKRYDDTIDPYYGSVLALAARLAGDGQRAHLVEVAATDGRDHLSFALGFRNILALGFSNRVPMRGAVAHWSRRPCWRALSGVRVGRDHLCHDLLADLDAFLDESELDFGRAALARQSLDALLRLVAHEACRHAKNSRGGVFRPLESGDQRVLLVVARHELSLARARRSGRHGGGLDFERRPGLLLDHLPCEVERDRVELRHARTLFDTRLHASTLIRDRKSVV